MSQAAAIPLRAPCPRCGYLADPSAGNLNFCPKCGTDLRASPDELRSVPRSMVGQVIADRYRLLAVLGEGGMGTVFKAEHVRMGKALAVKVLRGAFATEPAAVARFRAEAQIVSRLSHPHTIGVFDFGEIEGAEGGFYLAMEYVPGKDLAHVLREQRRLPEARVVAIADQLLGSLGEAHEAGIVHRDVKPGNVMLLQTRAEGDFVKVLDFGIAKLRDAAALPGGGAGPASSSETSAGAIIGTPNYLSPEQARGEELDARSDLYSVGAVLYELVSGRPPFQAANPMAIVSAHLSQPPPPLAGVAPGVSPGLAAVIHRALEKRRENRYQSTDEMRVALQKVADTGSSTMSLAPDAAEPVTTGDLEIAHRKDFTDLDRQIATIRRRRVLAPLVLSAVLVVAGLLAWRWSDAYVLLHERAPRLASALPSALRPADFFDGTEHEPNDVPARANPLPLPPDGEGRRARGVATIWGHVGAKINASTGDVDVFRIEIPAGEKPLVLHAEWSAAAPVGEGIRGLDVALTLNRGRAPGDTRSAPVVATVDRGGPGRAETLTAAVVPGTYYLAVREKHSAATGPVEKPTDPYTLRVWLAEPAPGEEVEPNDEPESIAQRYLRYPQWRALAGRNPLGEGRAVQASTSTEDPDTYAVVPREPGELPELVVLVPSPELALEAQVWAPDAEDLGPDRNQDRVRFQAAGEGGPGDLLFLRLPAVPRVEAPVLLRVKAVRGEGGYQAVALGEGSASGPAVLKLVDELVRAGRTGPALVLAAEFARQLPGSSAKGEVLLAAGKLAERLSGTAPGGPPGPASPGKAAAPDPSDVQRASQLLGEPLFDTTGGKPRYAGAFEGLVQGEGRVAEEASFRLVSRAQPCGPTEVARRAAFFVQRFPDSPMAPEARLLQARAEEEAYWRGNGKDAELQKRAVAAYGEAARSKAPEVAGEAKKALKRLGVKKPKRPARLPAVCR